MPTASDLLLNLSIQIEGEKGLETLAEELKALEAEQFKYNKQAQQTTAITQKVEGATRSNTSSFKESISTLKQYEAAARDNVSQLQRLLQNEKLSSAQREKLNDQLKIAQGELNNVNRAQGMLSDQIRMAQTTVAKYGQETQTNSDRQKVLSDNLSDLSSRLDAVKTRARDLQTQMRSGGEMSQAQADEFRKVSDRAKELERDAEKLASAFGNNRQETNSYRKVLVDTRAVQSRLSDAVAKNDGSFAQLSNRIADVNRSVNSMKNKFFESDLRAKELESSTMTLAQANAEVEKQNIGMTEAMQQHRSVLRGMRDELKELVEANEITRDEFNKLDKQLNSATANAGTSQRALQNLSKAFGSSAQVQNRATQALISFSQGLQDSPQFMMSAGAGFRAISNNMTQFQHMVSLLNDSIEEANGGTATFGMTVRALAKALKGPAGAMIAFTAVTTAVAVFTAGLDKAKRGSKETKESLDQLSSSLESTLVGFGSNIFEIQQLRKQIVASDILIRPFKPIISTLDDANEKLFTFKDAYQAVVDEIDIDKDIFGLRAPFGIPDPFFTIVDAANAVKTAIKGIEVQMGSMSAFAPVAAFRFIKSFIEIRGEIRENEQELESLAKRYGTTAEAIKKVVKEEQERNNELRARIALLGLEQTFVKVANLQDEIELLGVLTDQNQINAQSIRDRIKELEEEQRSIAGQIRQQTALRDTEVLSAESKENISRELLKLKTLYDANSQALTVYKGTIDGVNARIDALFRKVQERNMRRKVLLFSMPEIEDPGGEEDFLKFGLVDTAKFQARIDELTLAEKDYQVMRLESERDVEAQIQQIRLAGFNDEALFDRMRANARKAIEREITEDKEKNAEERQRIARQEALNNLSIVSQGLQNILGSFSQMSQQRAQASEKAAKREFENQKALSYATTVVAGAEAVVKALGNPLEVATAIAVTLAQLATISQQEFRASGTIGDGGSSGATSAMRTFSDSYGRSQPASRTLTRSDTLDTGRAPAGVAANQLGTPIVNVYNTANVDSKGLYLTTQHGRKEYERSTAQ